MYDQSFNLTTLERKIRKSDFIAYPNLAVPARRRSYIRSAIKSAQSGFNGRNPLRHIEVNGKRIYQIRSLGDELVVRHLCDNVRYVAAVPIQSREFVIANLIHLLREGVPYRVYRLDVRNYYESFSQGGVLGKLEGLSELSPVSKSLLTALFAKFSASGGKGLPRGLALSAVLSEFLMSEFDQYVKDVPGVYFYGRYVDDIIVLTSGEENDKAFTKLLAKHLPPGLHLHERKKQVLSASQPVSPAKASTQLFAFDYLGYEFSVREPVKDKNVRPLQQPREVVIDIAEAKMRKIKTRIARSFYSFSKSSDFPLLAQRLKYLTTNFSIKDFNNNRYKLAGIFYSYPQLTLQTGKSLGELDKFLKNAVLSKSGRLFSSTSKMLSPNQKRELLGNSFERGHATRKFVHFSPRVIEKIQACWIYE